MNKNNLKLNYTNSEPIYIMDENNIFYSEEEYLLFEKQQKKIIIRNRIIVMTGLLVILGWCFYQIGSFNIGVYNTLENNSTFQKNFIIGKNNV